MRVAPPISLTNEQRRELLAVANGRSVSVRFSQRARMILLAAEAKQDIEVAAELHVQRQTVARWRERFRALGIDGLRKDAPRGGRKRTARSDAQVRSIIRRTTQTCP